jgi:hypothetical protein
LYQSLALREHPKDPGTLDRATPGVNPVVALAYTATIDIPARFRNSKPVGPILGLMRGGEGRMREATLRALELFDRPFWQ